MFGAAVWSHSPFPSVLPHTSGKQTGCLAEEAALCSKLTIQARQKQVLMVGGMLCVADFTCLQLHIWVSREEAGSFLTLLSSVSWEQREKQRALTSLKEFFRAGMLSNFSEERVYLLYIPFPGCPGQQYPWTLQQKLGKRNLHEEGDFFPKLDSLSASRCQLLKQILPISHRIF